MSLRWGAPMLANLADVDLEATDHPDVAKAERSKPKVAELAPGLLNREDTALFLAKIGVSTLDSYSAAGDVPAPIKLGGRVCWSRAELEAWCQYGCPHRTLWKKLWPQIRANKPS